MSKVRDLDPIHQPQTFSRCQRASCTYTYLSMPNSNLKSFASVINFVLNKSVLSPQIDTILAVGATVLKYKTRVHACTSLEMLKQHGARLHNTCPHNDNHDSKVRSLLVSIPFGSNLVAFVSFIHSLLAAVLLFLPATRIGDTTMTRRPITNHHVVFENSNFLRT